MDSTRLKQLLAFWIPLVGAVYVAYSWYDFEYSYKADPMSDYGQKLAQVEQLKRDMVTLERRDQEMKEFLKTLDAKKVELAESSSRLFELKSAMSDRVDTPEFMKQVVTEAKKTGLTVLSIKPRQHADTEYYREIPFEFRFKGVFSQLFTFMGRITSMQRTVRVDELSLKPLSSSSAKFVELEGQLVLKTFAYLSSKEDSVAKQGAADPQAQPQVTGGGR